MGLCFKNNEEPCALARAKSGGAMEIAWKHFWLLIFLLLFWSSKKVKKRSEEMRTIR